MTAVLNIVLIEPEIPQNTGNVGRTCVALGATLHLVGKLGFSLEEKWIRRAGLDYWPKLTHRHYPDWESFEGTLPAGADVTFLSTKTDRVLWDKEFSTPAFLAFGNESRGLPAPFYERYRERLYRLPMAPGIRSLNLSTSVGAAAYAAARQLRSRLDLLI